MSLNTEHSVTLTEAQISIILYTLEDYMHKGNTSNDPDLPGEVDNIVGQLEGVVDKYNDKVAEAQSQQPTAEWED